MFNVNPSVFCSYPDCSTMSVAELGLKTSGYRILMTLLCVRHSLSLGCNLFSTSTYHCTVHNMSFKENFITIFLVVRFIL